MPAPAKKALASKGLVPFLIKRFRAGVLRGDGMQGPKNLAPEFYAT